MKSFIITPVVTEKSMQLIGNRQYQFFVPSWVEKAAVVRKISDLFNVTVISATSSQVKPRTVTFKRKIGTLAKYKKVTVRLAKDQVIAEFALPKKEDEKPAAKTEDTTEAVETTKPTVSKVKVRTKGSKE